MKKLFVFLLLFVSIVLYSQPKGLEQFTLINNRTELGNALMAKDGTMYKMNYGKDIGTYFAYYPLTAVGTKRAIDNISVILSKNNLSIHSPQMQDDLFASYVSSIYDYQSLNTSVSVGSSTVWRAWDIDQWRIALILDGETRGILIIKLE